MAYTMLCEFNAAPRFNHKLLGLLQGLWGEILQGQGLAYGGGQTG